jgi:hypothetical protein
MGFLNPVDTDEAVTSPNNLPVATKQQSILSPNNFQSPVILDFLEDDTFFKDDKRVKSRTQIGKREKLESEDFD